MVDPIDRWAPGNQWTVSTTGMTEAEAIQAAELLRSTFDVYVDPVDPRDFFTVHLDRFGMEMLRDALLSLQKVGGDVGGMLEDVDDWLAQAAPDGGDTPYKSINP